MAVFLVADPLRSLQDAERRRPRGDEASARSPSCTTSRAGCAAANAPGGPPCSGDSATIGLAAAPFSSRSLTDVQSLLCRSPYYAAPMRLPEDRGAISARHVGIIRAPRGMRAACRRGDRGRALPSPVTARIWFVRRLAIKSRLSPRFAWRGGRIFPWLRTGR
jgi:hypothetical protein